MQPAHLAKENASQRRAIMRQVQKAIGDLHASGERVTFYSVAKKARIARSTLYRREDLRKLVEESRSESGAPAQTAPARDGRIDELERKLAEVTAERDALASRNRWMAPTVRYASVGLAEAV